MEFTMKTEDLTTLLNSVKGTYGNPNFPVMNGIYFKVDTNGEGICRSVNGHESTKVKFNARVMQDGEIVLEAATLTKLVKTFAKGDITIAGNNHKGALISHPKGEVEITGMDPVDFPPDKEIQEQSSFMLPAKEISEALKKVDFARIKKPNGQNDIKLSGIGLKIENGKAVMATSDRRRVARYVFSASGANDINLVLAPGIANGLSSISGNIAVRMADNGIVFETNDTVYSGPVLATQYYDVNRFFPTQAPGTAVVPKSELIDTLERVAILGKAGNADPDAIMSFDVDTLDISYNVSSGRTKETIKIQYQGSPMKTKLNTDVVLDGLKRIEQSNVEILLHDPTKPVVFYPEGDRDFSFLAMAVV